MDKHRSAVRAGLLAVGCALGCALAPMSASADNIGVAQQLVPNERAQELTGMFQTLIGEWQGTYEYYDPRTGDYQGGPGHLEFSQLSVPNVIMLDATSERDGAPPVHAITVMVMQADGASLRQMVFREADGRVQDKVITGYEFEDEQNWRIDSVEVQHGLGVAAAVNTVFAMIDGRLEISKHRSFEGGEAAEREYESLAQFERVQ